MLDISQVTVNLGRIIMINDYSRYFQLDAGIIHLNHAAVGPWPVATARAVKDFADENAKFGSKDYEKWLRRETELRQKLATLIQAPSPDDIALLKSTSEGLSFIAHGLRWKPGENIVIPAEEFPSNRIVWQSLKTQGVELRCVPIYDSDSPEQVLIEAMDENTRLLSCSSVQYDSGLRLDLEKLGETCHKKQVLFCVDAIQSLGAVGFDVQAVQADFVVADGHKWMLAPEGLALFYCRDELRDQLQLHEFGWHMVDKLYDFDQLEWAPAFSSRRFECGSPNMMGVAALSASLDVLFEVGLDQVEAAVLHNSNTLFEALSAMDDAELLSPESRSRRAGIVTFNKPQVSTDQLYAHLQANGVICAPRGGGIRLSPHFHTTQQQLDKTIDLIRNCTA
jgi:selenocysteine lyase/cysteine desulfurase